MTENLKVTIDGEPVKELHFHMKGEDGQFLWIEFVTKKGVKIQSYYMKGVVKQCER